MAFSACSRRCITAISCPASRPLGAGLTTLTGARATIRGALAPQPARIAAPRTLFANASNAGPSSFPASDLSPPRPSTIQPGRNRLPAAERAQQDEWLVQWVKAHGTHAWKKAVPEFRAHFPTAALGSRPIQRLTDMYNQRAVKRLAPADRAQLRPPSWVTAAERAQHNEWLVQWVKAHGTRAWKKAVQEFTVQFPTAALGSKPNQRLSIMYHNCALKKLAPADHA
ncbi:hypothetical protein TSOC_008373 [Tetrabaena socialis]|uniref:Uncharacterized protein n=1 Tax=Tetrabaena socialis TaxID=47790 RepID=A0A2J7ZYM1_9CHLO|nr:hypothetical protein TSOC_008373 [Tetrabaena socialis]|eukprot:PNH05367.1 hypothetical protein TSOC_008373 [Tetrabaena socialis]